MKTTVSIPDDVYEQTEKIARQLAVRRSRLITQALRGLIRNHKAGHLTERLNETHKETQLDEEMDSASVENLRRLTRCDAW